MSFSERKINLQSTYYIIKLPYLNLEGFWDVQDELSGIYEYSFQFSSFNFGRLGLRPWCSMVSPSH